MSYLKRFLGVALLVLMLLPLAACSSPKVISGTKYDTYGLFNSDDKKNPGIQYQLVWGNVIWGVLLSETIIAPIYFFGFDIFEPVGPKPGVRG